MGSASPKSLRYAIMGMVALCAIVLGYITWQGGRGGVAANFGAPFTLESTKGGRLESASMIGKPYALFFGFTHCPEICPTTLYEMSAAMKELGDEAKDFHVLFVTVDPERDTVPVLKDYLANFDPRVEGLVPSMAELTDVTHAFHIYYKKVPTSDGSYTMDHTATLFLFGRDGKLKSTISYEEDRPTRIEKIKRLLAAG